MKITIGSDHAGFEHKLKIIKFLEQQPNLKILDVGPFNSESVDYPDYAHLLAKEVFMGADFGILICGSGNGISMAANKHKNIRCAVCWNIEITKLARAHNDANVISLPARFLSINKCIELITAFLKEAFEGGRHLRRVEKI